jgi:hypothetical protein
MAPPLLRYPSMRRPFAWLSVLIATGCDSPDHRGLDPLAPLAIAAERPTPQRSDETLIASLREQPIARVSKGRGGRSLAFRLELADGTRAYFKPEQTFAAHWFSEVASYHLDRELGLGRVAPVTGRRLPWRRLAAAGGSDWRVSELRIGKDGSVRGAMIAWIEGEVPSLKLPAGWEAWIRFDEPDRVTPFQRPEGWRAKRRGPRARAAPEPDRPERAAELSDLILFDILIGNLDRWGSDFTNLRTRGKGGPLLFLDNANGFHRGKPAGPLLRARLEAVQRFRKSTIEAIEKLDLEAFAARLAKDPLAPILDDGLLQGLAARRELLLRHVAEMERHHGAAVFAW